MGFLVGLTGGIGSGKTTVADLFATHGVALVDADVIAHEMTGPGGLAMDAIRQAFGSGMLNPDGSLNRAAMRQRAFEQPGERARLESILHPAIRNESQRQIMRAALTAPYVINVVPLLVESGPRSPRLDRLVVVDCPREVQIARVMSRSRLPREQVEAILRAQASREQRKAAADDIIDNGGDPAALPEQVRRLHRHYLGLAMTTAAEPTGLSMQPL